MRFVKYSVQDQEWGHVVALATVGMSHKCIATEAYGSTSKSSLSRVRYILRMEGSSVINYRNGKNPTGRSMIVAIRRGGDVLSAIRKATANTVAALKRASA